MKTPEIVLELSATIFGPRARDCAETPRHHEPASIVPPRFAFCLCLLLLPCRVGG